MIQEKKRKNNGKLILRKLSPEDPPDMERFRHQIPSVFSIMEDPPKKQGFPCACFFGGSWFGLFV